MKVAVVTKPNMNEDSARLNILKELSRDISFDITECRNAGEISPDTDRVLVFGGDGTVLDAVRTISGRDIPIVGVNLGNLGFLTAFEKDVDPIKVINALKCGKFVERMLLDVETDVAVGVKALNEVVIKTADPRPITLEVYVDGKFVDSYHSDGIIVSSPAGSTAYSLSAGGPVLAPDVDAIVINPICAHSLHSRPLVVSANSEVSVKLTGECGAALVSVDGGYNGALKRNSALKVVRSKQTAKFLLSDNDNFFVKLLKKMNRWGTTTDLIDKK